MFVSGQTFSNNGYEFANQLIKLYTINLGDNFKILISVWTIFELIYTGLDFYDDEVKGNIKQLNLFMIMKKIKQCISFNRFETIHNINNEVMLRSLHRLFEPIFPSRIRGAEKTSWDYI